MNERTTMAGKPVFTVPTKTAINFKSKFDKKLLCDGMTFTAGSGCVYRCSFCYVESMQKKQEQWFKDNGVVYPPEGHLGVVIRTKNVVELLRQQILSKSEAFRSEHHVIYSSPKVDVAGNMELVYETVEICKVILELTNWDIRLLSKSNLLPKVAELLQDWWYVKYSEWDVPPLPPTARVIYGVSTGTLDDKLAAAFEEGTPKVSKRIESLRWLQDNGFRTFGMICPSLPQPDYDKFAGEMFAAIRAEKCEYVWAEVINVRGESFTRTEKCLRDAGFDHEADALKVVSNNKEAWELYARETFLAHAKQPYRPGQLRFLQYVTKQTRPWWEAQTGKGAVLL